MTRDEFVNAVAEMAGEVWSFHERWRLEAGSPDGRHPVGAMKERRPLIVEELRELDEAVDAGVSSEICEEAADVLFVAIGHIKSMGAAGVSGVRTVTTKNAHKTDETHAIHPETGKVTAREKLAR